MNPLKQPGPFIAGLALALATASPAQEAEVKEALPRYQVELLVFTNQDQARTTAEIPRMPEPEIADILEQDLARADMPPPELVTSEEVIETEPYWQPVEPKQHLLNGVAERIDRVDAYGLLTHLAWRQAAPDVSEAIELELSELGADARLIGGNVNLFKQRYLHLAVDVQLLDAAADSVSNPGNSDAFQLFGVPKAIPAITDSRRIRLEQIQYFDQPQFGIIAMVARIEEPEPATEP
ncbi:MAG: CsiV family protein [Gammaproteobacteria bacterium]|jgi:hypothetical protein|nr:CsiV family protein [Gammaproteobacteria bacterium]MDP6615854.1 CsiV family protein [Gammaproteobacteria bacterium]MDP6694328.1 CsiV family protein [Gammaproteobacteria bacterium]MDP7041305.1 CsiV family protein [Gammaproteobacteria bacterium]